MSVDVELRGAVEVQIPGPNATIEVEAFGKPGAQGKQGPPGPTGPAGSSPFASLDKAKSDLFDPADADMAGGWGGGDVASNMRLSDGRNMFLWGDTLTGDISEARRWTNPHGFERRSITISAPGQKIDKGTYYGEDSSLLTPLKTPPGGPTGEWVWFGGLAGLDDGSDAYAFCQGMVPDSGSFGFTESRRTYLAHFNTSNPAALTLVKFDLFLIENTVTGIIWGDAAWTGDDGKIYVSGRRTASDGQHDVYLCRSTPANLFTGTQASKEFWTGTAWTMGGTPAPIGRFPFTPSDFRQIGGHWFALVATFYGDALQLWSSPDLTGEWANLGDAFYYPRTDACFYYSPRFVPQWDDATGLAVIIPRNSKDDPVEPWEYQPIVVRLSRTLVSPSDPEAADAAKTAATAAESAATSATTAQTAAAASAQAATDAAALVDAPAGTVIDTYLGGDSAGLVGTVANKVDQRANILDDGTDDHAALFGLTQPAKLITKSSNLGLGYFAFKNGAYTGLGSVAVGDVAGMAATTGSNLTFVGYYAGGAVTTKGEVTHVGSYAGFEVPGEYNTSLGARAMCGPNVPRDPANPNTGLSGAAYNAWLTTTPTGIRNTAIGREALSTLGAGSDNTAVGYEAGGGQGPQLAVSDISVSGTTVTVTIPNTGNVIVGEPFMFAAPIPGFTSNAPVQSRLYNVTGKTSTTFTYEQDPAPVGTYAGGSHVLLGVISGNKNTAVGAMAMFVNQRGHNNSALGADALTNMDGGSHNSAFGASALNRQTSGSYNTAVGRQAGFFVTTGANNTFVGVDAGLTSNTANATTTAQGQTIVGSFAGQYNDSVSNHITAIGGAAKAAGHQATAIGRSTVANGNGAVAIGCDNLGVGANATGLNSFVLGTSAHRYRMPGLPTTNPGAGSGILWNDGGVVKVA